MEQQIRFCTASDGVSIAYATVGDGPPLVYVTGWPTHLEMEWGKPFSRAFLEALAEGSTLFRYDMRGSGLSDQDVSDFSIESLTRDLEAVVDHQKLERFALASLGSLAVRIAAQAQGDEIFASDVIRQLVAGKGFLFADRGESALRGFEDPVRVYEVGWEG